MKKLYTTAKWAEYSKKRSKKELEKASRRKSYLKRKHRADFGVPAVVRRQERSQIRLITVKAPESLSFINHPTQMIQYLDEIRSVSKRKVLPAKRKKGRPYRHRIRMSTYRELGT